MDFDPKRVVVLLGPTGSGKTELTTFLASHFDLEIVCMDSMQLYREMVIGTAMPSPEELHAAPSHLFASFSVNEPMTSVRYAELAGAKIGEIQRRGRLPLLVGGTGMYMQFLFHPRTNLPQTPDRLRLRLAYLVEKKGMDHLYRLLKRLDKRSANHLHAGDRQRVQRFLEVRLLTGRSMLDLWDEQASASSAIPCAIGLEVPRDILWQRLEQRTHTMFASGLVEEARMITKLGLAHQVARIGPIGYRALFAHLANELSLDDAKQQMYIATRRYAKRQMTWFRKVPYIQWFPYCTRSGYNKDLIVSSIHRCVISA
ncbi:MAG: tRNA (adenosine(37)-N6)-dimethylallyltransferase MiaA [Acidobacteria bacterium]|nr:tRNA (adenosine(37)-N6)-dimethylallyltransferase MiaA [Acidobacteriota bacterium]